MTSPALSGDGLTEFDDVTGSQGGHGTYTNTHTHTRSAGGLAAFVTTHTHTHTYTHTYTNTHTHTHSAGGLAAFVASRYHRGRGRLSLALTTSAGVFGAVSMAVALASALNEEMVRHVVSVIRCASKLGILVTLTA